ncbi:hypothetical protein HSB1_40450 [Halogranum salarium B-1]|uniref:Uncharacterized protein n=1 Tax=Halogranum salarium B-1 TaxID=1210908 RepID=J3JDQ1_9EURY|nr:hypothetical protein HSB1_40450 [Halogranum salarium B-1]
MSDGTVVETTQSQNPAVRRWFDSPAGRATESKKASVHTTKLWSCEERSLRLFPSAIDESDLRIQMDIRERIRARTGTRSGCRKVLAVEPSLLERVQFPQELHVR